MIYNGSDTSSNSYVSYVSFNSDKTDPTYVGYMYSNTLNTSYEDTISNDNDSLIKTILDSWYEKTFISKGYDTYITDSGFCNDRNLISGDGFTANEATIYAPQERFGNYSSVFTCSNMANDLFTQKGNNIGNGKLTYPIGLITVDELAYAGFTSNSLNTMNYLNEPYTYWTMSPYGMSATVQSKMYTLNGVNGSVSNSNTNVAKYARPLINLKADTEISGGIGTANDPFIVK